MYKNNQICAVEADGLTTELLVSYCCKEAPIVFITENGRLIGAVTVGDIKRSLSGGLPSPERLINRNISRLVLSDGTALEAEAEKIFQAHPNIQNIPVTDPVGQLLYELVRDEQAISATVRLCKSYILEAGRFGASEYFSNAFGNADKILLTGAKADTLTAIRTMLKEFLEGQSLYSIPVEIEENITQCLNEPESTLIISAGFIGAAYLTLKSAYRVNVISLDELYTFAEYSKLPAFTTAVAANLTSLFGYETFIFRSDNCYTRKMIQIIQACGISAYTAKETAKKINGGFYRSADILALSHEFLSEQSPMNEDVSMAHTPADQTCTDRIPISRFLELAELLYAYNKMMDRPFFAEDYIESSIQYLSAVRSAYGYDTLIHTISCPLDRQLNRQIRAAKIMDTVIYPDTCNTPPLQNISA